ncbi:hypothetical protein Sta7437_0585 [Stanieria cyanosphaera PCC 7437]|uniref:Uncharacterized protein n=1 Tax=Stanieria cyanosphaera (strain ATCC 29371 / PCC 7437) TaxID=111780 RepID=K9XNJ4_STAC7|nr:hypothetical protein [Stanieria cyanosphaera]AFZ34185.1 hypothetical protein Sta7437_0585 [Stanieria cyanosphaera PCC 7437]
MKIKFIFIWLLIIAIFLAINLSSHQKILSQSSTEFSGEISSLRSRISRLESDVRRLNQMNLRSDRAYTQPSQESLPSISNPPSVNGQSIGRSDPMFERLATLLIELKEDVRNFDQRLTTIEQQINN